MLHVTVFAFVLKKTLRIGFTETESHPIQGKKEKPYFFNLLLNFQTFCVKMEVWYKAQQADKPCYVPFSKHSSQNDLV